MDADALMQWKARIFNYQKHIGESRSPQQTSLFDLALAHCAPEDIDPFSLIIQHNALLEDAC